MWLKNNLSECWHSWRQRGSLEGKNFREQIVWSSLNMLNNRKALKWEKICIGVEMGKVRLTDVRQPSQPGRASLPGWLCSQKLQSLLGTSWVCYFIPPPAASLSHCPVLCPTATAWDLFEIDPSVYSSLHCQQLVQCPANRKCPINLTEWMNKRAGFYSSKIQRFIAMRVLQGNE
jgi:hypothetical protein